MKLSQFTFFVLFINDVLSDSPRGGSCPLPKIKNGRIRSRQRGRVIKFVCQPGFHLAGERNAFCINGIWDMPTPKCVRTTCPKKETPPPNGLILPSHGGGVLNFYCKQGFELHGPAAVFCDGDVWDNHMPVCLPANTKPQLFCDFENVDICHWTHDLNHDMDWKRDSYKTPTGYSMETGPSFDHTKGEGGNGHYMYIESSSRRMNDTARLISPIFSNTTSNTCLEFWYHMYGRTTGSLRAYMKRVTDPWPLKPEDAIFTKSGNQGDVWYRALVNLGVIGQDYQIILEGVRGNGYVSDTAVDDVRIIENCAYEDLIMSTTEIPPPVSEFLKTIDSCENRCGNVTTKTDDSQSISCDCDDFCYENARCCPDFLDFCFPSFSTTDGETTTDYENLSESPLLIPSNSTAKNSTEVERNPLKTQLASQSPSTVTEKRIPPTKKVVPTTKKVLPTTKKVSPPKKPLLVPTRRPLIFVQETTPVIYRKIYPNSPPQNKNTSKITFVKPKIQVNEDISSNDVNEVPTKPNGSDEELLLTSPVPLEEDNNIPLQEKEDYVEKIANDKEVFENNEVYPENLGKIKTEFRQSQSELSNVKTIFVVVATLCGVATLAIILTLVLIQYRVVRCRNRRMRSGNGDSQSDVRFLTADEVLDFSLDNDDL